MASEAQVAANRRNAKRSTGPRSRVGKARVAKNAIRHGLAGPVLRAPAAAGRIRRLADAFLSDGPRTDMIEDAALRAGEAQYLIEQTRQARALLLEHADPILGPLVSGRTRRKREQARRAVEKVPEDVLGGDRKQRYLDFFALLEAQDSPQSLRTGRERQAAILDGVAARLERLDRYERRALSRRRRALHDLAEATKGQTTKRGRRPDRE